MERQKITTNVTNSFRERLHKNSDLRNKPPTIKISGNQKFEKVRIYFMILQLKVYLHFLRWDSKLNQSIDLPTGEFPPNFSFALIEFPFKPKTHRASAATLVLPLPLEYIVTLGNGSGTNFQASPHHHRPALAAAADARCDYTLRRYFFKIIPSPTYDFPEQGVPTPRGRQPVILAIFSPKTTSNWKKKAIAPGGGVPSVPLWPVNDFRLIRSV